VNLSNKLVLSSDLKFVFNPMNIGICSFIQLNRISVVNFPIIGNDACSAFENADGYDNLCEIGYAVHGVGLMSATKMRPVFSSSQMTPRAEFISQMTLASPADVQMALTRNFPLSDWMNNFIQGFERFNMGIV
jgi:hypothetical protein